MEEEKQYHPKRAREGGRGGSTTTHKTDWRVEAAPSTFISVNKEGTKKTLPWKTSLAPEWSQLVSIWSVIQWLFSHILKNSEIPKKTTHINRSERRERSTTQNEEDGTVAPPQRRLGGREQEGPPLYFTSFYINLLYSLTNSTLTLTSTFYPLPLTLYTLHFALCSLCFAVHTVPCTLDLVLLTLYPSQPAPKKGLRTATPLRKRRRIGVEGSTTNRELRRPSFGLMWLSPSPFPPCRRGAAVPPPSEWCCFLLLFLFGGAFFPLHFRVVLLYPVRSFERRCFGLLSSFWWCCFSSLLLFGVLRLIGGVFSSKNVCKLTFYQAGQFSFKLHIFGGWCEQSVYFSKEKHENDFVCKLTPAVRRDFSLSFAFSLLSSLFFFSVHTESKLSRQMTPPTEERSTHRNGINQTSGSINEERQCTTIH